MEFPLQTDMNNLQRGTKSRLLFGIPFRFCMEEADRPPGRSPFGQASCLEATILMIWSMIRLRLMMLLAWY
jgi:hypothetical protein